jgi:DNA repair protein RadB
MENRNIEKIPTGSQEFSQWLGGGYAKDIITTIYGPAGSGKTNLCLMASAIQALKGKKVIFIDTEGGFSAERLNQIVLSNGWLNKKIDMQNILLLKPTTFAEQRQAFNRLLDEISKTKQIGLIVVDSIAMLYRLELGIVKSEFTDDINEEKQEERQKNKIRLVNLALARQLRILNEIARKKAIPVLVTNQVYSSFDTHDVSMVGGDLLKYWSKCLIQLQIEEGKRIALLKKHRWLQEKKFMFKIIDKGIARIKFSLF